MRPHVAASITSHTPPGISYRAEIDGLRAFAVVPVILFHAGFEHFSGGYVGVDIFFVISGFLITSIIVREKNLGRFSLVQFYERRARRILPALFVVLALTAAGSWWLMVPLHLESFGMSLIAVVVFASNIFFWRTNEYFGTAADELPLLHTWSLGVEEQYYLLFPLLVMILWRLRRFWLTGALIVTTVVSLALSEWAGQRGMVTANFFLAPTRAWELLVGSLLAITTVRVDFSRVLNPALRALLAFAGLLCVCLPMFLYSDETRFPGLSALPPVLGSGLLIAFASPENVVGRLLSMRAFVGIGLVSYSAYLWHQPLFALARLAWPTELGAAHYAALILATALLAYLSWRFVEVPFRDRERVGRRAIFVGSAAGMVVFAALGMAITTHEGFHASYVARLDPAARKLHTTLERAIASGSYNAMQDDGACHFWSRSVTADFERRFAECAVRHGDALVVVGDSHAMDLYNAVALNLSQPFIVGISQGGCRPDTPGDPCQLGLTREFLSRQQQHLGLILYTQSGGHFLKRERTLPLQADAIRHAEHYVAELARAEAPVVWLGPQPEMYQDVRGVNLRHGRVRAEFKEAIAAVDAQLARDSVGKPYRYLSKIALMRFDPRDFFHDGEFTYSDGDHWSTAGERLFGARLLEAESLREVFRERFQRR